MDRSAIVKVSSPCDSILIATRSLYANKRLNSVGDDRLNGVRADTSLMDRPRPSNTIFDERLHVDCENSCCNKPTALSSIAIL